MSRKRADLLELEGQGRLRRDKNAAMAALRRALAALTHVADLTLATA